MSVLGKASAIGARDVAGEAITPYAKRTVIVSVLGYALDSFDLLLLGFALPWISADFGLTTVQSTSLVTATLAGSVLGGIVFGALSDRLGRVRVLTWTILLFAVFTGACALARGYQDLLIYRVIAGMGLGGEFGIGMTLVAESWPRAWRARAASFVAIGWQLGAMAAAILVPVLVTTVGWRGMFVAGLAPAVVSFLVRRAVPEPALFVQHQATAKRQNPFALLFKDRRTALSSIAVLVLCSVQNFGYYALMIWLPSYLSQTLGYSLTKSAVWTLVTIIGMCIGIFAFGQMADRLGRKPAFYLFQVGAAIMVVVYAHLHSPIALLIGGSVMGVFVNGMIGGYGAVIAELYPTEARATAQNVLFNLGRGVGGFGPVVIGALISRAGFGTAMMALSGIYVLDLIVTAVLLPETKGANLE